MTRSEHHTNPAIDLPTDPEALRAFVRSPIGRYGLKLFLREGVKHYFGKDVEINQEALEYVSEKLVEALTPKKKDEP